MKIYNIKSYPWKDPSLFTIELNTEYKIDTGVDDIHTIKFLAFFLNGNIEAILDDKIKHRYKPNSNGDHFFAFITT